ncbi:hypothetical protein AGOR_G00152830 [Albula goreensis]|uniref:Uncharacterized protein n=1 Tax=Albula goreensis TaxID=1534307 RepID=A0A8T3D331_9TELE|nr:hypothetical protein AGOR_G00152830 [Albula goreensis]
MQTGVESNEVTGQTLQKKSSFSLFPSAGNGWAFRGVSVLCAVRAPSPVGLTHSSHAASQAVGASPAFTVRAELSFTEEALTRDRAPHPTPPHPAQHPISLPPGRPDRSHL